MFIIWFCFLKVGKIVYILCCVEGEGVTECIVNEEFILDIFVLEVLRNCYWYNDIVNCVEKFVMFGMN